MNRYSSFNIRAGRSLAIIGLSAVVSLGFGVVPAMAAAPGTVTAVTHTMHHPDTTSNGGACTVNSSGGPVWAYDNLSLNYSVTPTGFDTYSVMITAHGSFNAFADPNTGACYTGHGSVNGWLQYDVTSTVAPDPAAVPAQENGSLGQTAILLTQLFGGDPHAAVSGGGSYNYTYTLVDGVQYTQVG